MFVLLNRPEDIEGRLPELKDIAITHRIKKLYVARILRPFGSRARRIVAPHKLDLAAQISDAATSNYFSKIADDLCTEGVEVEPICTSIPAVEIDKFIDKNDVDLIVTTDGRSGLCRWPSRDLVGRHVLFLCEHIFGEERATFH